MGDGGSGRLVAVYRPLYQQVREALLDRIRAGDWQPGLPLPNELTLAEEFGVGIGTVRRAIEGLERSGIVRRKQGRGTFLTGGGLPGDGPLGCPLQLVDRQCGPLGSQTLAMRTRRMSEAERELLKARVAGDVLDSSILIGRGGEPAAHERSLIPLARLPAAIPGPADIEDVRASLSAFGLGATRCVDSLGLADRECADAALLRCAGDEPLLECRRTAFSADFKPVEHRVLIFRPSELRYVGHIG